MPRSAQAIEGLLQGVSEQPEAIRLPQHGRRQVNFYDKLGRGKITRPPTEHVARVTTDALGDLFEHDLGNDFTALFTDGAVRVVDAAGAEHPVEFPDGVEYLRTPTPSSDIRCVTADGTTYIINRSKTVALGPSSAFPPQENQALVVVQQGALGATYKVILNWSTHAVAVRATVPNGSDPTVAEIDSVTNQLYTSLVNDPEVSADFAVAQDKTHGVIYLKRNDGGDFEIAVDDSIEGDGLRYVQGAVETLEELPPKIDIPSLQGMLVKVKGTDTTNLDDYWMRFWIAPSGDLTWLESSGPGELGAFDGDTFVWTLADEDGTWRCRQAAAALRNAGDAVTCPAPSFVGMSLGSVFFYHGRLGLTAGDYVVMSQAGEPLNFWRQTARALLADDVIDVRAAGSSSGVYHTAIEWHGELWLWSDRAQNVLSGEPVLTPQTVRIDRMTTYENDPRCEPMASGSRIFFLQRNGPTVVVNEYALPPNGSDTPDATDLTAHVPTYLQGTPKMHLADDTRNLYMVLCEDFVGYQTLYVYVYALRGGERVQASWSEWLPGVGSRVLSMRARRGLVRYLLKRDDGAYLETQNLDHESEMRRFDPTALAATYLDRRLIDTDPTVVTEFDGTDTTYTLPYPHENRVAVASVDDGAVFPVTYVDADSVKVPGNLMRASVVIGVPYESVFELGTLRFRNPRTNLPRLDGRLMLQAVVVNHDGAAATLEVTRGSGSTLTASREFGEPTTDRLKCSAFGNSTEIKVAIRGAGPRLCAVNSVEWEGAFIPTIRRIG